MLLAWNGRWEPRQAPTPDVVLELTPGSHGLVVTRARPEVKVNGQPWQAPIPLGPGDRIAFGAGGVEVLSIGSTLGGSHLNSQSRTQSASGSSLNPSLGSGSGGSGGRVAAPSVGSQVGRYLLQEPLGSGQFGTVFRAQDTQLGREVALKLLVRATERAQQRFIREVQATAKLQHPNLVTTYDGGEVEGWLYLAMEVVIGRTLREAGRDPSVTQEQKIRWVAQSARAVSYVNATGVLHRDIKPSNIMIDGEGQARVVDFGMAGIESEETQRLTKTGAALGTPAYMAPEVLYKGGQEAGPASEVYSLGASLYALLTGRSPRQQLNEEPEAFGQVAPEEPEWLVTAIERAMHFKPEERFPDGDALADALEAGLTAPEPSRGGPPLAAIAAGAAVLLALGGGAAFIASRPSSAGPSPSPSPSMPPSVAASATPSATPAASATALSPSERLAAARAAIAAGRTSAPWKELAPQVAELRAASSSEGPEGARDLLLELYLERGRLSELTKVVGATPAFAQRRDLLAARVWLTVGERERALAVLADLAGSEPSTHTQRAAAALRCLWLGSPDAALRALPAAGASAAEADPDLAWIAGRVHLARAELSAGRAYLPHLSPEDPRLEVALTRAALAEDPQAGLAQIEPRLALQQEVAPAAARLTASLAARAEAWPSVARWLDRIPQDLRAPADLVLLGRALQAQARPEDAVAAFRAAFSRDPVLTWRAISRLPEELRLDAWESVSEDGPSDWPLSGRALPPPLHEAAGGAAEAARGPLVTALEAAFKGAPWQELGPKVDSALEAGPKDGVTASWCARVLVGRDRFERALSILARAREAGAPAAALDRLEAELWLRRGQVDVARRRYATLAKGESLDARIARCELGWLQGDAKGGAALGERLVADHPDSAPAFLALAVNLINLRQDEPALKALRRSIALEGGINARALMFRALLVARKEASAIDRYGSFEQLFALTEGASPRILAASLALTRREAMPWIQSELSRARAHEPKRPELYLWLGVAGLQAGENHPSGRRSEVDRLWRELLRLQPGFRIPESVAAAYRKRYGEPFRR